MLQKLFSKIQHAFCILLQQLFQLISSLVEVVVLHQLEHASVAEGGDMTSEAAMTKLMWAIGQGMDQAEIAAFFGQNIAGEITTM